MRTTVILGVSLALCQAKEIITFPWVGLPNLVDGHATYFTELLGSPVATNGQDTTYEAGCSSTKCAGWEGRELTEIKYKVVVGPSTYRFEANDGFQSSTSECAFAGAPTPTAATCTDHNAYKLGTHTGRSAEYTIPAATGVLEFWSINMATMTVEAAGEAPTGTAPSDKASGDANTSNDESTITTPPSFKGTSPTASQASSASSPDSKSGSVVIRSSLGLLASAVAAGIVHIIVQ